VVPHFAASRRRRSTAAKLSKAQAPQREAKSGCC